MINTITGLIWEKENRESYWAWLRISWQPPFPTGSGREKEGVRSWEEKRMHLVMPLAFPRNVIFPKNFQNLLHRLPWICKCYHKLYFFSWEKHPFPTVCEFSTYSLPNGSLFVKISPSPCSDLLLFLKVANSPITTTRLSQIHLSMTLLYCLRLSHKSLW